MVVRSASRGQSLRALDWLNVFLADIQGGVGPFLVVYLTSSLHWNPAEVGLVMTISGLAGVVAQTPVGALIDQVRNKRSLIVMAAILIAISSIAVVTFPFFPIRVSKYYTSVGRSLLRVLVFFWFFMRETRPVSSKSEMSYTEQIKS